ncbi:hypothetical protein ACFOD1_02680 [Pseudidiomarina halophila]|uniref:Polysaccharide chain length determinant N-terminal domain-containing protein n=1 Tax=Pseudidiomarina halophila TaxID=1449799 RepID=A0A432XYM7_9GAMM|nr:hypothetical protein [Pseudidiomarina halophila]RUO53865.1 hypothetical protein CWI69_00015 [Pseudidiomarina halophila]
MNKLAITDYLRWLSRHWLLLLIYFGSGIVLAYFYASHLPKIYRASVLFTLNPAVYQQGILREVDDTVLGINSAYASKALTRRPEVRVAFYASSPKFASLVSDELYRKQKNVRSTFDSYTDFEMFTRKYLHYYRFEYDESHIIHWHSYQLSNIKDELTTILESLEQSLLKEISEDLKFQIIILKELLNEDHIEDFSKIIAYQLTIAETRLKLITSKNFSLINIITGIEVNTGPVYPKKNWVIVTFLVFWIIIGVTGLNLYLLRKVEKST